MVLTLCIFDGRIGGAIVGRGAGSVASSSLVLLFFCGGRESPKFG